MDFLLGRKALDIRRGLTVKEITNELDESESVIRLDLYSMKVDGVERDSKRIPNVFWLSKEVGDDARAL